MNIYKRDFPQIHEFFCSSRWSLLKPRRPKMGYCRYSGFNRFANNVQRKLKLIRTQTQESRISLSSSQSSFKNGLIFYDQSTTFGSRVSSESKSLFSRRLSHLISYKSRQELVKLQLANFLSTYFDFAYFVCLCPFRLVSESSHFGSGYGYEFSVSTWWPQKTACAIVSFLSLLWFIRDVRLSAPKDPKNPSLHFRLLLKILGLLMKATTIKRFWMNREEFRNILNFIAAEGNPLPVKQIRILNKHFIRFLCVLYTGVGISNWICGLGLGAYSDSVSTDDHISNWSRTWWWTSMVNASNYNFFRKPLKENASTISGADRFFAIPGAIGFLEMHILANYCEFLVLMAALTLWTGAYSFALNLGVNVNSMEGNTLKVISHPTDEKEWLKIYSQYRALKRLASFVNLAIGSNITFFLLEAIMYYATRLDEVFFKEEQHDECEVVRFIFFFCNTTAILLFSADVCKQMNTLKTWLCEEESRVKIAGDKLLVLLNDLDSHTVGIRGNNIFAITYSLIANMVGTTVTYFIICVQAGSSISGGHVENHYYYYFPGNDSNNTNSTNTTVSSLES